MVIVIDCREERGDKMKVCAFNICAVKNRILDVKGH